MIWSKKKSNQKPKGKPNERVYAIGDIHGCYQEMVALIDMIHRDCAARKDKQTYLIFLGDLIDRGPDSRGVIEHLMRFPHEFATPLFIMGNHEEMMVRGLMGEPELLSGWLDHGGYSCAESYGVPRSYLQGQEPDAQEHVLRSAIPKSHAMFLKGFLESVQFGDYLFAHAGIRPGVPLDQQSGREMRWIRGPFLEHEGQRLAEAANVQEAGCGVIPCGLQQNMIGLMVAQDIIDQIRRERDLAAGLFLSRKAPLDQSGNHGTIAKSPLHEVTFSQPGIEIISHHVLGEQGLQIERGQIAQPPD